MWGKGPQTAYQVQRVAGHGRAVSFWLQTAASLPEAAQHPMQLLSVGAAAVQPLRWRQGFLAPLRLCFLPRFWMSQTATGHQRLPREALETRPWPWSPAVAAAAASLFLHPLPCPSAFLRTPRWGWRQKSPPLRRTRRSRSRRRKVSAESRGAGGPGRRRAPVQRKPRCSGCSLPACWVGSCGCDGRGSRAIGLRWGGLLKLQWLPSRWGVASAGWRMWAGSCADKTPQR